MAALNEIRIPAEIVIPVVVRERASGGGDNDETQMIVTADLFNARIEISIPPPGATPIT